MREVKFKAWDKELKIMRDVIEVAWKEGVLDTITVWDKLEVHGIEMDAKHFVLLQYTGLKGKNGKEIYEGDIVRCYSSTKCPHEIIFLDEVPGSAIIGGMPGFYLSGLKEGYSWGGKEELIGNIYKNPELVKEVVV